MNRATAVAAPVAAPAANNADMRFGHTLRVQRQCACGGPAGITATCEDCRRKKLLGLQASAVGPADDAWAREAEHIADEVMAGQRRGAATPVQSLAQRASVESCATGRGDQGTIAAGPLAKWDWVRYRDHIKLGNRVFKSPQKVNGQVVTGPDGKSVMARLVVGGWPWLTNNPGDITVDIEQIGQPRHAQNRAYDFGAMPRRSVSNGHVTYRCDGRDKTEGPKISATVRGMYLKAIPDTTPAGVSKLLGCELPPAHRRVDRAAAQASSPAQSLPSSGSGQALEPDVRHDLESRFGIDFGQVRVHADSRRDLAIEPVAVDPTERKLSEAGIKAAIVFNAGKLKGKQALALVRDMLGVAKEPAVSDRTLALAVARFRAAHGVARERQLGPVTMLLVVEDFQAEDLAAEAQGLKEGFAKGRFMDIDASFCGCEPVLEREIKEADRHVGQYTAGGAVSLTGQRKGACGPLLERIDLAHEQIHSVHEGELQQASGKGAAFTKARDDKSHGVNNEIQARNTDKSLARWAPAVLDRTCA